jgi:hypothetical protein
MPVCLLSLYKPELDWAILDVNGYAVIHYAVAFNNLEAIRHFWQLDKKNLSVKSCEDQSPLSIAARFSNLPVFKFISDREKENFDTQDKYGFSVVTYMIKFNFLVGLMYFLHKGGKFTKETVDTKGCNWAHWASFMDRRLMLAICWRVGVDLLCKDECRLNSFDRALDNWSVHTVSLLADHTNRPLKANYFLLGHTGDRLPKIDFVGDDLVNEDKMMGQSIWLRRKKIMWDQQKRGMFDNYQNLMANTKIKTLWRDIKNFVMIRWDEDNLSYRYGVIVFMLTVLSMASYSMTLITPTFEKFTAKALAAYQAELWEKFLFNLIVLLIYIGLTVRFALKNDIKQDLEEYREKQKRTDGVVKDEEFLSKTRRNPNYFDLNSYFIQTCDYEDYLDMYGINHPLLNHIIDSIDNNELEYLGNLNDASFCGHCLIKKAPKTRHCPNTNLCIPKYQFYSKFFDKPVYFKNEFLYLILISLQMYLLYAFHSMFYDFNYEQLTLESVWISPVYILFVLQKSKLYFAFLVYAALLYLWAIVAWNWAIFWYAIFHNYTLDELFNPNYYPYLSKVNIGGEAHKAA